MGGGRQVIPSFFGVRLLLAFVLLTAVAAGRDFYSILGVKKSATDKQIKKAYRSLAAKYHPDRNPGDKKAADKFNDISAAHAALTDADQRCICTSANPVQILSTILLFFHDVSFHVRLGNCTIVKGKKD